MFTEEQKKQFLALREQYQKDTFDKRSSNKKYRDLVINHYSSGTPQCVCCGENIVQFLTIDHVNNDGAKHRKNIKTDLCRWIVNNKFPSGFQLMCYNCNCGRAHNNNICPHKTQSQILNSDKLEQDTPTQTGKGLAEKQTNGPDAIVGESDVDRSEVF